MAKRVKHRGDYYLKLYASMAVVHDFSFKPKRGVFTPAQKSALSRRAFKKGETDDGNVIYSRTHLYNIAKLVEDEKYSVIKPRGKKARNKLKWSKNNGFFTHQDKIVIRKENIDKPRIVEAGDDFVIEYKYSTKASTGAKSVTRYELFIPFPVSIRGDAVLCEAYIMHVQKCFRNFEIALAINGNASKVSFDSKLMNAYAHDAFCRQEQSGGVYLNGVYVISHKPVNPKKYKCVNAIELNDVYVTADELDGCDEDDEEF